GGAAADAAAVLVGLNELFGVGLSEGDLRGIGVRIGADVPFCISGGTALGEGIGERLTPLPAPPDHRLLLLKPKSSAETAEVYRAYDERPGHPGPVEPTLKALWVGDLESLAASLNNDLASTTRNFVSVVAEYEKNLLEKGALGACMSGTGTAVYGMFENEDDIPRKAGTEAPFSGVFEPVPRGVLIL
ncbi:MAG TPA: hypothetical protein VFE21_05410, partial [Rubrobacteraceae bacterium]|nr:hypothetical protein [Rubrobacteraceae bacterium]